MKSFKLSDRLRFSSIFVDEVRRSPRFPVSVESCHMVTRAHDFSRPNCHASRHRASPSPLSSTSRSHPSCSESTLANNHGFRISCTCSSRHCNWSDVCCLAGDAKGSPTDVRNADSCLGFLECSMLTCLFECVRTDLSGPVSSSR